MHPPARQDLAVRRLGTPLPLCFLAQAVASTSLACVQLRWLPADQAHAVAWSVLSLTVPLQLLAAVIAFAVGDSVVAVSGGLLAGAWAATSVTVLNVAPGATSAGLGVVVICVGAALLVPAAAGISRLAASAVALVSAARFATTGIYETTASGSWQTVAGCVGIALAAVSTYAALGFELESQFGRAILPVGHLDLTGGARRGTR